MSAEGVNEATIVGNLGADPRLGVTPTGQAVLNLRVCTTESYMDGKGRRAERVDWHTVVVWGKQAESLAKILQRGHRVFVRGRMQTRTYEKNGQKHYTTEVVAQRLILLTPRSASSANAPSGARDTEPPRQRGGSDGDDENEIPF